MPEITLTLPTANYLDAIQRCASDPRVSATCHVPYPYPADGAQQWLERTLISTREQKNAVFLVLWNGELCGIVSLNAIDWETHAAELDYWVAGDFQGRGVGTEAARQAIRYAGQVLNLKVLLSSCLVTNPASGRVLMKNGFSEIGRFIHDGKRGFKFLGKEMRRFRLDIGDDTSESKGACELSGSTENTSIKLSVSLADKAVHAAG